MLVTAATLVVVVVVLLLLIAVVRETAALRAAVRDTGSATRVTQEMLARQDVVLGSVRQDVVGTRTELRDELARFGTQVDGQLRSARLEDGARAESMRVELSGTLAEARADQARRLEQLAARVDGMSAANETRFEALRASVDERLREMRTDNAAQLEQMRATVDEKLQTTLETRLGESFRLVCAQLDRVQSGLGEMQALATGVGDLKRVLTNVKTRGTWGEVQLGMLLEQIFAPEQYAANVAVKAGSQERVEFAVKFPGDTDGPVWLPIDAKFPQEDYLRLEEARELGDPAAVESAAKALEASIRGSAKTIAMKYLDPPRTTDIGIMFLPTESLYAEVARRPGLLETLQSEHRVVVAGPSTLAALLNSFQMGFRTLAIQKRSSEVWTVLGVVKTEVGKFDKLLNAVHRKLQEATNKVEETQKRTRILGGRMKEVEALPSPLPALPAPDSTPAELPELDVDVDEAA